jgi:hypothetical protein
MVLVVTLALYVDECTRTLICEGVIRSLTPHARHGARQSLSTDLDELSERLSR